MRSGFEDLLGRRPVPGPRDTLIAIAKALQRQIDRPGYDLSKITVNAWAEALHDPDIHKQAYRFCNETHKTLAKFAELSQSEGLVGADADATVTSTNRLPRRDWPTGSSRSPALADQHGLADIWVRRLLAVP